MATKIKLKSVISGYNALQELIAADKTNKFIFASATRIKFAGNVRRARPLYEDYLNVRNVLIEKFGTKQPNGSFMILPTSEGAASFSKEDKDALEVAVDIKFHPVKTSDLGENQISIDTLEALLEAGLVTE